MNFKHGMCGSRTWTSWQMMHRRCAGYTETHRKHYTDKGIKVCERWEDFNAFLADMGTRPEGMTLDRIDINGPYSPENCRWATHTEQMGNRSNSVHITLNGVTKCMSQWAKELGLTHETIKQRLRKGWPVEMVLSAQRFYYRSGRRPYKEKQNGL